MNNRKFVNLLAYIAIILITLSTVLSFLASRVFHWDSFIAGICQKVSFYVALFVTISCAFYYATSKRNTTYMFILILAIIIIVLFMFVL